MTFTDLNIIEPILRALEDEGYENPTPIQKQAIPAVLSGKDVLGLAQTGTGKTAAFAVPMLQLLHQDIERANKPKIRALVLTPTRELGIQIQESFENYSHYLPLRSTVIFGGTSQGKQVTELRKGVDVLVATPGRLIDLINQGYVKLDHLEMFVLDEADRMLDMGFIHDIKRILKYLPKRKQTLLFSATMPSEIKDIVDQLLHNPVKVSVAPVSSAVDTVEQFVQYVDQNHKIDLFESFMKSIHGEPVLVFTRTKRGADRVVRDLKRRHIEAMAIHGNKSQNARQLALTSFKEYAVQVLVATDIAARGIDINELPYVINYDMPDVPETYVHRIGRTGRAGKEGQSISFVSYNEIPMLKEVERLTKKKLTVIENTEYPLVDKTPKKKNTPKAKKPKDKTVKHSEAKDKTKDRLKDKKKKKQGGKKVWEYNTPEPETKQKPHRPKRKNKDIGRGKKPVGKPKDRGARHGSQKTK